MVVLNMAPSSRISIANPISSLKIPGNSHSPLKVQITQIPTIYSTTSPNPVRAHTQSNSITSSSSNNSVPDESTTTLPSMSEIMGSSRSQNLDLRFQTLGPFFRIRAISMETKREVGRAEGMTRYWLGGKILHLDSIRLQRETLGMEKSIFGIGLFIGAVAIRYGYERGCRTAELLAINDSDLYHSKLIRFYTRIGFKAVHEVTGLSFGDLSHMLIWGGKGTRMDADIEELLMKWARRFKSGN